MNIKNLLLILFLCCLGMNAQAQCYAKMYYSIQGDTVNFYGDSSNTSNGYFSWSFGDGSSSSKMNPTKIYKNGTFTVCLTITDSANKCSDTICKTLTIYKPAYCKANFTWRSYIPFGTKTVMWFSDSSNNVYSKFTFGDSTSQKRFRNMSENVFHTYDSAGTYNVCLFLYDLNSKGDTVLCDSICKTIVVYPHSCGSNFTYTVSGKKATFKTNNSGSWKNDYWNFGDGKVSSRPVDTNDMLINHTYAVNGKYLVSQFLYDSIQSFYCSVFSDTIVIDNIICKANFSWRNASPNGNKPVIHFVDSTYTVYSILTFGDNTSYKRYRSMDMNIYHTYDSAGTYNACLFVYDLNSKGDTVLCDSICKTIVVYPLSCSGHFTYAISGKKVTFKTNNTGNWKMDYWYFGDGTNSTRYVDTNDAYTNHTYAANGTYIVYQYLYDSALKSICSVYSDTIFINDTSGCKAKYTYTITGDSVIITNKSTGNWKSEKWDMGDGITINKAASPNQTFIYVYNCKGTYSPKLSLYENANYTVLCNQYIDTVITKGAVGCNANYTSTIYSNIVTFNTNSTGSYCNEQWDFGDGYTTWYLKGAMTTITHTYAKVGTYSVCYKLYDNSGVCSQVCKSIVITQMSGTCVSNFTWYQPDCTSGDSIPSIGFVSSNQSIKIIWTFGDGTANVGRSTNLGHQYKTEGTYKVCLFDYKLDWKNDTVLCDSICINVYAQSYGNIAKISSKVSGDTVVFTNNSVGNWNTEFWDFGDGDTTSTFTGKNGTITHIYKKNGTYFPNLKINDFVKKKLCTYAFDTIFINKPVCQASFYLAIDTTTKFNLYIIQNSKGTTSYTKYLWRFGDGDTSHAKSPTHQYKTFGLYNLCLTIIDSSKNCYHTFCDSIGLDSNGKLLKMQGFTLTVFDEKDILSAPDNKDLRQLQVYPNPSNGIINITLQSTSNSDLEIETFNALGQIIQTKRIETQLGRNTFAIDLTHEQPGLYFLHIKQGNQTVTKRILLQNN